MTPTPRTRTHVYHTCTVCRKQYRQRKGEKLKATCSAECRRLYLRGKRAEPPKCDTCGGPVELSPFASRQRTTCSDECSLAQKRAKGKSKSSGYCPTPEQIKAACEEIKAKNLAAKRRGERCQNNR